MKAPPFTASHKNLLWIALPLVYLAVRFSLLFFSPHYIYRSEELYQGYIGTEILSGLQSSYSDYQIDPYTGGSLVAGAMAAFFFKLFGSSLFTLKLVPLLFSFASFVTAIAFLQRFFGRRAAVLGGLLFTFPAPALASLSLIALGSHPESRLFVVGALFAFYELLFNPKAHVRLSSFLLFFLSGLAVWFSRINYLFIISFITTWVLLRPKAKLSLPAAAAGLSLGVSAWLVISLKQRFASAHFFADTIQSVDFGSLWVFMRSWLFQMVRLVLVEIPASFSPFTEVYLVDRLFVFIYTWIVLYFFVLLFQRFTVASWRDIQTEGFSEIRRKQMLFFVVFPVVFIVGMSFVTLFTSFHGEFLPYRFRYFASFYVYFILLTAILSSRCRRWTYGAYLILLGLGAIGYLMLLSPQNTGRLLKVPGYSIESTQRLWRSYGIPDSYWDEKSIPELASNRELFFKALYQDSFWNTNYFSITPEEIAVFDAQQRLSFLRQAGKYGARISTLESLEVPEWLQKDMEEMFWIGFVEDLDWTSLLTDLKQMNAYKAQIPEPYRQWFYYNLARNAVIWDPKRFFMEYASEEMLNYVSLLPMEKRVWFYRGTGAGFLRHFPNLNPLRRHREKLLYLIPPALQNEFFWGLGRNLRRRLGRFDLKWLEKQIQTLPPEDQDRIREGFIAYQEKWYGLTK